MKFECQESCGGKCCKPSWDGKAGFVFLTSDDLARLSNFLKKPFKTFAQKAMFSSTRFTKKKSLQWFLKDGERQCRFLTEGRCSVYEARPTQCKTFPFWPENMATESNNDLKEYCPGVGKGTEVHSLLAEQVEADKELSGRL